MTTISVTHQSIQSNNKASRQRNSTLQTSKHRDDIALANYMSPKMRSNKQADPAQPMTGYPLAAPNGHGGAYPTSAEWATYYQQYHQVMTQQQQKQQHPGPYYYAPSYQHPCYQQPYHPNNHGTWVDQSQSLKPQRSTSTPVPRPSTSSRPTSRLGNSNTSPRNNPLYWSHQQHQQQHYYDPRPSRTSSSSSSTVSATSSSDFSTGRRSSVTSVASSVVSEVSSISSKRSISRRLRDVFKSAPPPPSPSPSTTKTTTEQQRQERGPRRRSSIRALSSLFQRNNIVPTVLEEELEEETTTAVADVQVQMDKEHQGSSVISSASNSSSSTAIADQDEPTEKSTITAAKRIQFYPTIQVHETFSSGEYDRRCDAEATCQKLTPLMGIKIKQELNEYKLTDMQVHVESRRYTHFLL